MHLSFFHSFQIVFGRTGTGGVQEYIHFGTRLLRFRLPRLLNGEQNYL